LPSASIELAEQTVHTLREKNPDKPISNAIYCYLKDSFGYGAEEAVLSGRRFRFPHEIKSQYTCGEGNLYAFMLARAAGLDPMIFCVEDMGERDSTHFYVDVRGRRGREALDPLFQLSGPVKYSPGFIAVKGKKTRFRSMQLMDDEDICSFADYLNSDEGINDYLTGKIRVGDTKWELGVLEQYAYRSVYTGRFNISFIFNGIPSWDTSAVFHYNEPWDFLIEFGRNDWGRIEDPFFQYQKRLEDGVEHRSVFYDRARAPRGLFWEAFITGMMLSLYYDDPEKYSADAEKYMKGIIKGVEKGDDSNKGFVEYIDELKRDNPACVNVFIFHDLLKALYHDKDSRRKVLKDVRKRSMRTALWGVASTIDRNKYDYLIKLTDNPVNQQLFEWYKKVN
jgi:hypothetical protein